MKFFFSAPKSTDAQLGGREAIIERLQKFGEIVEAPLPRRLDGVRPAIQSADIVVAWADTLYDGQSLCLISQVAKELRVPFPPDLRNVIGVGMAVLDRSQKRVLLPGQAPKFDPAKVPTEMVAQLQGNEFLCVISQGNLNIIHPDVAADILLAAVLGKRILVVALKTPACGDVITELTPEDGVIVSPTVDGVELILTEMQNGKALNEIQALFDTSDVG